MLRYVDPSPVPIEVIDPVTVFLTELRVKIDQSLSKGPQFVANPLYTNQES